MPRSGKQYPYSPEELRKIRETEIDLSIKEVARRLGYAFSTVQRYETGESRIPPGFFVDFETLRAELAREREAEAARRTRRPTHPELEAEIVALELPVDVAMRLHAALGNALVRRGHALALQARNGEQVEPGSGHKAELPEPAPLAVLMGPGTPIPPRVLAVLLRGIFMRKRLLPSEVSACRFPLALYVVPLAVLVSRPNPQVPHPVAKLRRSMRNPVWMLPATAGAGRRAPQHRKSKRRLVLSVAAVVVLVGGVIAVLALWQPPRENIAPVAETASSECSAQSSPVADPNREEQEAQEQSTTGGADAGTEVVRLVNQAAPMTRPVQKQRVAPCPAEIDEFNGYCWSKWPFTPGQVKAGMCDQAGVYEPSPGWCRQHNQGYRPYLDDRTGTAVDPQ